MIRSLEGDDYEDAVRLGQMLLAGGFDNPLVHQAIGMAALYMENVDLAEKELQQAEERKALDEGRIGFAAHRNTVFPSTADTVTIGHAIASTHGICLC